MADRFYFSPDVGCMVERDGNYYTEYGDVLSVNSDSIFRMMPIESCENYADWTEEHRTAVRDSAKRRAEQERDTSAKRRSKRRDLVHSATLKLTEDEYDALYEFFTEAAS